jgi:hypothetical protein
MQQVQTAFGQLHGKSCALKTLINVWRGCYVFVVDSVSVAKFDVFRASCGEEWCVPETVKQERGG